MKDYTQLRALLEKEPYPHRFLFKFVGKNTDAFELGTRNLEALFPDLVMVTLRLSQNENHASYTYSLEAESAEQIIEIYQVIEEIKDLEILL